jgi:hypothetical protein
MFLVPENGLVPSVQKVNFESKFIVFVGYHWVAVIKLTFNSCLW